MFILPAKSARVAQRTMSDERITLVVHIRPQGALF
jgi:hypothetical protein